VRWTLFSEIVAMSWDTLRVNKLRSALTVLGVVIGITSIVGMTSLVRGFDESLRDSIRTIGPDTIFISQFSGLSMASGADFQDLLRRPSLTLGDADAIERGAPSIEVASVILGQGGAGSAEVISYRGQQTTRVPILGVEENYQRLTMLPLTLGRFFTPAEVQRRRSVIILGQSPFQALFPNVDPIGKTVRVGLAQYEVIGIFDKRPSAGMLGGDADAFAVIPQTAYQKQFGLRAVNVGRG
jgi:putative ABC transport system permease protein